MLYSKNGSIPKPETDGTDGWIEVSDPPSASAGKEVVWWYPPGWVVRDLKPETVDVGNVWKWSQTTEAWVSYTLNKPNPLVGTEVVWGNTAWVFREVAKPNIVDGEYLIWEDNEWVVKQNTDPAGNVTPG